MLQNYLLLISLHVKEARPKERERERERERDDGMPKKHDPKKKEKGG